MGLSFQYDEAHLILDYFARHPRAGLMIDVGAHFGSSFRPYLKLGWRAVAFEPDSTKFPKLQNHLSDLNFSLIQKAVGAEPADDVQFFTSPESTGIATLVPFRDSHEASEKVPVTTLSIELTRLNIRSIDYLKIDTEGYDLHVLRGHDWSVLPEVIMCEFDERKTLPIGHDYTALGDLLLSRGYTAWLSEWDPLVKYGSGHTWHAIKPYPCRLNHADAWGNIVAIRNDSHAATLRELIAPHA